MPASRGLTADDIETLRAAVSAGRRPKVVFTTSAGQMAGQTGQVTTLGDPGETDEFISVRFGRDKLEFAPSDLQLPAKAPAGRKPRPSRPEPGPTPQHGPAAVADAAPAPSAPGKAEPPAPAPAGESAIRPARRSRSKTPAELTITLSWHDGDWTLQAHRGTRALAKPTPVRAAEALRMVTHLDNAAVTDAVNEIVTAARVAAADRAEQLRHELAEVEARLAELPEPN